MGFWGWVITVFILYALFDTIRNNLTGRTAGRTGSQTLQGCFEWPELGQFDVDVVGESHYQGELKMLVSEHTSKGVSHECIAVLVPEDDNEYDKKAVRVDIDGYTVGYLDSEDAKAFRRRLSRNKHPGEASKCKALIRGGYQMRNGPTAFYGVALDIKSFD